MVGIFSDPATRNLQQTSPYIHPRQGPMFQSSINHHRAWSTVQAERPLRLLHVPTMKSVERGEGCTYECEKLSKNTLVVKYNILSYTWGRWRSETDKPIAIHGSPWKIPAVQPDHFIPEDFANVLRIISKDVEYVWVDVACINQGRGQNDLAESMDQIGKQMAIFSGASQAFVWLCKSSKSLLQESFEDITEMALQLQDELYSLRNAKDKTQEMENSVYNRVEGIRNSSEKFCSDPWFSSLWTLQESVLRRDAFILSREGETLLAPDGKSPISLAIVGNHYRNLLKDINRHIEYMDQIPSRLGEVLLKLKSHVESNVLAFMVCSNPNVPYSLAQHRTSKRLEDQVYGIMQVYGFQLGKTMEPNKTFTLEDLKIQLSHQLNHRSPMLAQMFVHVETPAVGRSWQITQKCRVPPSLISYEQQPPEDRDCKITINGDQHASIRGNAWYFSEMFNFLTENFGNIMVDRNLNVGNGTWANIKGSDPLSLYSANSNLPTIWDNIRNGLLDPANGLLAREDLMLVYMGKVEDWKATPAKPNPQVVFLGLILLQERKGNQGHWVRVGICTWYAPVNKLPLLAPFEGLCW